MRHFDALTSATDGVLRAHPCGLESIEFMAQESHLDAEVHAWVDFIQNHYIAPESLDNTLVLLPCSERKPYRLSKSHRKFIDAIGTNGCHEVMVTSPLGLVPEILRMYGLQDSMIFLSQGIGRDELDRVHSMVESLLARHHYRCVINHSGIELNINDIEIIDTPR